MRTCVLLALFIVELAFASSQPVPSGAVKVFKGPEGEVITVLEVNDSKEVLVEFKGVKGDMNGQTRLLKINSRSDGSQEYFYSKKKGSKTKDIPVMEGGKGSWRFLQPGINNWLYLSYSEALSKSASKESLLNNYKP